jgi:putative membrane protein
MLFYGWSGMPWFAGVAIVAGMLFWTLVVSLVVWGAARLFAGRAAERGDETMLEILKKRYARGEITSAEFEQARHQLT